MMMMMECVVSGFWVVRWTLGVHSGRGLLHNSWHGRLARLCCLFKRLAERCLKPLKLPAHGLVAMDDDNDDDDDD
jgi:hypothetical protein